MRRENYKLKQVAVSLLLVLGVAGCAGSGVGAKAASPQLEAKDEVARLATDRWVALVRGDLAKAYEYLSPGTRAITPLLSYATRVRGMGMWKKATVDSVSCEQDRCNVTMIIEFDYREVKAIQSPVHEVWLREGNKWWYVPGN